MERIEQLLKDADANRYQTLNRLGVEPQITDRDQRKPPPQGNSY